jgi:hypothetical protein
MSNQLLDFNGIDAESGLPAFPSCSLDELLKVARGHRPNRGEIELALRHKYDTEQQFLDLEDGVDPCRLDEAGWGVVFPRQGDPAIREALEPLLRWREEQAKARDERLFRVYEGTAGKRVGFSSREVLSHFLERRGAADGPVRPRQMPYYLLLVGQPDEIPFEFQYQLDVRYAVGRLTFDTPEEYAQYAANVVAIEKRYAEGALPTRRRAVLFAPSGQGNGVEDFIARGLVQPLFEELQPSCPSSFDLGTAQGSDATRERLLTLLRGPEAADLVFTGCHGLIYPTPSPTALPHQGALLCYGRSGQESVRSFAVGASDVLDTAGPTGQITLHFGCFSAGVPVWDAYEVRPEGEPRRYADKPLVTALPQHLLSQPGSPTLAVIGHVDRAWTYSFATKQGNPRIGVFEQTLLRLLRGVPVGHALEPFNVRHAALSAAWVALLQREQLEPWAAPTPDEMVDTFCAWLDARSFVVLGDPAVRLAVRENGGGR